MDTYDWICHIILIVFSGIGRGVVHPERHIQKGWHFESQTNLGDNQFKTQEKKRNSFLPQNADKEMY